MVMTSYFFQLFPEWTLGCPSQSTPSIIEIIVRFAKRIVVSVGAVNLFYFFFCFHFFLASYIYIEYILLFACMLVS